MREGGTEGEEENLKQTPELGAWGGVGGARGLDLTTLR